MPWEVSDVFGVEDDLMAFGPEVWNRWNEMLPTLLDDPSPTNPGLHITETDQGRHLWLPETDVYILIHLTADDHILLLGAVDLMQDLD